MLNKIKSGKGCIILRNKKIIYNICLIVTLVGLIAIISGTSYAVLKGNTSAEKEQVVQNGNVTVTLTEYFESINKKINILSDEEG